ncbi:CoA-binding protein [Motiliproteus sediminis]|uniref:CoA-binding protein n=1 Tax=Motiliproteus sediminis TaxID=1468178 RepID=UPI001AF00D70|nr:CoA-binding protein [Motiliproteus sediminis]
MHLQYDDSLLRDLLTSVKVIALVGASPKPQRDSHRVMAYLQAHGYRVIPVNPQAGADELLGERVYPDLDSIPASIKVDMVEVFRRSEELPEVAEAAIRIGAKVLWGQLGVIHGVAARRAADYGLTVIMDRCPKLEIPRLGLEQNPVDRRG